MAPPSADAYDVPDGTRAVPCADCGRPFPDDDLLALHRGLVHDDAITASDREQVEAARAAESTRLRRFRLQTLVVLVVLYFGLLMVYAVVT